MQQYLPLAVLKQERAGLVIATKLFEVATVLTACGIETLALVVYAVARPQLQQYLPLAVLKRSIKCFTKLYQWLQQYLPLAVLKPFSLLLSPFEN